MLGIASEFSISVSQGLEMLNSTLPSDSAIFWLSSVTSRVVIRSLERISFSCSPALKMNPAPDMVSEAATLTYFFFDNWHPAKAFHGKGQSWISRRGADSGESGRAECELQR